MLRLKSRTEDEAHNLTSDDPVWELVKAADQAVLATATPLKQVAELQGVARASVCQIWCLPGTAASDPYSTSVCLDESDAIVLALAEAVGFQMSFQEAIESKLITDYRLWLPDATTTEAWQGSC